MMAMGAHRADGHACISRTVYVAEARRVVRFRVVTSPRLDDDQLGTLASLRKPRLAPVARTALACLGVLTGAIVMVSGGDIVPADAPTPVVAEVAPVATTTVPDPPIVSRPVEPDVPDADEPVVVEPPVLTPAPSPARLHPRPTVSVPLPVEVYPPVKSLDGMPRHSKHPKGAVQ